MFRFLIVYKLIFILLGSLVLPSLDHCHDHDHDFSEELSCLECQNYQINIFINQIDKETYPCSASSTLIFDKCVAKQSIFYKNFSSRAPPAL